MSLHERFGGSFERFFVRFRFGIDSERKNGRNEQERVRVGARKIADREIAFFPILRLANAGRQSTGDGENAVVQNGLSAEQLFFDEADGLRICGAQPGGVGPFVDGKGLDLFSPGHNRDGAKLHGKLLRKLRRSAAICGAERNNIFRKFVYLDNNRRKGIRLEQ